MDFNSYQEQAKVTDQFTRPERSLASSIWNLNETVGILSRKYDSNNRKNLTKEEYLYDIERKLGDILWYVSNIASCHEIPLSEIAHKNLTKCSSRWGKKTHKLELFDKDFPETQRFPRKISFEMAEIEPGNVQLIIRDNLGNKHRRGSIVNDNNYQNDGYRFHDAIHISFMAVLGWSPVMRSLFNFKRKNNKTIDTVEDGARARNLEEAISAMIFEYARELNFFEKRTEVPLDLLRSIDKITKNLEVSKATFADWENAILQGYNMFRLMKKNNGGIITADLIKRKVSYSKASK